MKTQPEVWLRGMLPQYSPGLQPVAHAILQAQEEINILMMDFPTELLWENLAGMASPAFHLQHIAGVMDRMSTYAKAERLSSEQFDYLKAEGERNSQLTTQELVKQLDQQISKFLEVLSQTDPATITEYRGVGRAQLPSTVGGILFHAAEHTQRHFGQLLVTCKVLISK